MTDMAPHENIPPITLGWRLRIALDRADIKAEAMAHQLGVHRGTVTRWTHDIGRPPRPIYLHKWAEICDVSYTWLAGDLDTDGETGTPTRRYRASTLVSAA